MTTFQEICRLLYTYDDEEYKERAWTPNYSFEIKGTNRFLYYFGANHSRNSDDPQYDRLRKYWADFLEKTKGINAVVFIEGGIRNVRDNEKNSIQLDSEAGFITLLSDKAGIARYCPEPLPEDIKRYVLSTFSEDELNYYYFARTVSQWNRIPEPRPPFEHYVQGFSIEELKRLHSKITSTEFNENDRELFDLLSNPTKLNNPLYKLIRAFGVYRNAYIVQEIEKTWKEGKSMFIVYGGSHAILQERALRTLLN